MMKSKHLLAVIKLRQLRIPILFLCAYSLFFFPSHAEAKVVFFPRWQQEIKVMGLVEDDMGRPLPGVSVLVKGTNNGTKTDENGRYTLQLADEGQSLIFRYIGFLDKEIQVGSQRSIHVVMGHNIQSMDEVVVVGYGQQKKSTIAGAVASISGDEVNTTKNQNVQNMLTGKLPGVRVVQKTSEPGDFSNVFDIRGFGGPLVVVDGVPRGTFAQLDPNDIESVSVLKDASAAVYGVRAANGVVLITTKKGMPGKAKISYSGYYGFQEAIGMPKPVGVIDRFTLMNEKTMRNINSPTLTYNDDDFAPYLNGTLQGTDWYDLVMRKTAPQEQHNVSASGSSKDNSVDYYINMGYTAQGGYWRANSLNYDRYNLRSNINAKITDRITASLKLNGIIDERSQPTKPAWEIFKALWTAQPNEPYYANNNPDYFYQAANTHPGVFVDADVSGFQKAKSNWIQSQFSLDYKVPFIEGLLAKGMFAYDNRFNDNTNFRKAFSVYRYNAASDLYVPSQLNGPDQINRSNSTNPTTLMQLSLNYTKSIDQVHNVNTLLLYEEGKGTGDGYNATRQLGIPLPYLFAGISEGQTIGGGDVYEDATKAVVGRANYDYKGKYMAEFSFRYDGSSRFPKSKQWVFFPAGLVAWRLSEENFIKNNASLSFINNLKIRGSYGTVGDDGALRYQFVSGYDYPFTGGDPLALPGGYVFNGSFVNSLGFRSAPNLDITWSTSSMTNIGLDADFWNGKLGLVVDVFRRHRKDLLADRLVTVPGTFGTTMPQENLNSDETRGAELALTHRSRIGDLGINIGGNISITRTKILYRERNRPGSAYDNWRNNNVNRYNDVWFGYGYVGQFQSNQEIANYDVFTARGTLPGDYIYEDWNGDGVFDAMDSYPIATSTNKDNAHVPLMNFGLNLGFQYKGFDLNLLFQGGAMSYVSYGEQLREALAWDGNALDLFLDRWHPADPKVDPFDPNIEWIKGDLAYTGNWINQDSRRSIQNGAYLRLKSAELGYSLPKELLEKVGIQHIRLFANAYNLLTFTGVRGLDPEHPAELYGYMYPQSRTLNFGASITF